MYGEYQTASIEFDNTALADLSRLVPLDSDASGIPEAILLNTATNKQNRSVPVTVIGSMCNLLAITGLIVFAFSNFLGAPDIKNQEEQGLETRLWHRPRT